MALGSGRAGGGLNRVVRQATRRRRPTGTGAGVPGQPTPPTRSPSTGRFPQPGGGTSAVAAGTSAAGQAAQRAASRYQAAAARQERLIKRYVWHQEKHDLIQKHVEFNAQGEAVGFKVPPRQIGEDLHAAAQKIRQADPRSVLSENGAAKIEAANQRGKVVPVKRIAQMIKTERAPLRAATPQPEISVDPATGRVDIPVHLTGGTERFLHQEARKSPFYWAEKSAKTASYPSNLEFAAALATAPFPELRGAVLAAKAGEALLSRGGEAATIAEEGVRAATGLGKGAKAARAVGAAARSKLPQSLQKADQALLSRGVARLAGKVAPKTAARISEAGTQAAERLPGAARYGKALEQAPVRTLGATGAASFGAVHPKLTGSKLLTALRAHGEALIEEPGKTISTTGKATVGFAVAPLQIAANVGISGGRAASEALHTAGIPGFKGYSRSEIVQPTEDQVKAIVEYGAGIAHTFSSGDLEREKRAIEEHYGLTLPIMAVPGILRLSEPIRSRTLENLRRKAEGRRERISQEVAQERATAAREGRPPQPRIMRKAEGKLRRRAQPRPVSEKAQPIFRATEQRAQRKEVAREYATARTRARAEGGRVMRRMEKARRKVTGARGIRGTGKVTPEELAFTLATRGIPRDREAGMAEIDHLASRIKPQRVEEFHDAAAIHYIRTHPDEVWGNEGLWKLVDETKGLAAETSRSETARYAPIARAHGELLTSERIPFSAREVTRSKGMKGVEAKTILRDEIRQRVQDAKGLRSKAGRLEAKSAEARKTGNTRRADNLRAEATALREGARAHDEAANIQRAALGQTGVTDSLLKEYVSDLNAVIGRRNLEQPALLHQGNVLKQKSALRTGLAQTYRRGIPSRTKRSQGIVAERGLAKSSFAQMLSDMYEWRARETMRNYIAHMVDRFSIRFPRSFTDRFGVVGETGWDVKPPPMTVITGEMADVAVREGLIDAKQNAVIDMGKIKGAVEEGTDAQLASLKADFGRDLADIQRSGKLDPKRAYVVWPKAAHTEFFKQLEEGLAAGRVFQAINSTVAKTILFSPAWQVAQVLAESLQASLAVNPYRLIKGSGIWNKIPERERLAAEAEFGAVPGTGTTPERDVFITTDLAERQASTHTALNRTGWGSVARDVGKLDVLRKLDAWKGGQIRGAVAMGKLDRDLHGFTTRMKGLIGIHSEIVRELRGKSEAEIAEWVGNHPEKLNELGSYTNDAMGDWKTITSHERPLATATLFYPFLRMAVKWTFQTFPMRHPLKFAAFEFLAGEHAEEVRRNFGEPSFFSDWATMLLDVGPGQKVPISMSRVVPGANPLLQVTGQGLGPQTFGAVQPIIALPVSALFGKSLLTGDDIKGNKWAYLISQFARLPAPVRAIDAFTGPRSSQAIPIIGPKRGGDPLSQLINAISPTPTKKAFSSFGIPFIPEDMEKLADGAKLSKALDRMQGNSRTDLQTAYGSGDITLREAKSRYKLHEQGSNTLHNLYRKYGIGFKGEEKSFSRRSSKFLSAITPGGEESSGGRYSGLLGGGGGAYTGLPGFGKGSAKESPYSGLEGFGSGQPKQGKSKQAKAKASPKAKQVLASVPAIGNSRQVAGKVTAEAKKHDLPPSVLMAQIEQETGFSAGSTSSAGAGGETQFIPSTAAAYGVRFGTSAKAINSQIEGQARYMSDLKQQNGGDLEAALNSYYGSSAPYTDASGTGSYAQKVFAKAGKFKALDQLAPGAVQGAPVVASSKQAVKPLPKQAHRYIKRAHSGVHLRFNPIFAQHLVKLARLSGEPVIVNSGFRTLQEQQAAYADYQAGGALAAEPGTSNHEYGRAADLQLTTKQRSVLSKAGLSLPVPGEDWHVELSSPKVRAEVGYGTTSAPSASGTAVGTTAIQTASSVSAAPSAPAKPVARTQTGRRIETPADRLRLLQLIQGREKPAGMQRLLGLPTTEAQPASVVVPAQLEQFTKARKRLLVTR